MLKIVRSVKDTYITNKIVKGERKVESNVGAAGTLDLFKIYGMSLSGSTSSHKEISRILIQFDIEDIKSMFADGRLDVNHPSFWCKIHLKDVYGGQTVPADFTVSVFPLSSSFDEGIGKDVSYYSDKDVCNWISSSRTEEWFSDGCSLACDAQTSQGDFITSSVGLTNTEVNQRFVKGYEDLIVDVTKIISSTLSGKIPDRGFRISLKSDLEEDQKTYFVKRFASSQAYDESKHPRLLLGFDDSITDDTQNLVFDTDCSLKLYNYSQGAPTNLTSGSTLSTITGSNSIILKLMTEVSGGLYDLIFTGSQYSLGSNYVDGIYTATVNVPSSNSTIKNKIAVSGSIEFTPVWSSLDGTVAYVTGSRIEMRQQTRSSSKIFKNYTVSTIDVKESYEDNEEPQIRVNFFDKTSPLIKIVKTPVIIPGIVLKNAYYQIRDAVTDEPIVPFDTVYNSTKISSDSDGMFFKFDTASLIPGRTYLIDIMIDANGTKTKFLNVSPVFKVTKAEE